MCLTLHPTFHYIREQKKSDFIECLISPKNGHARPQALKVLEIRKQGWQEVASFARGVSSQTSFSLNIHFLHVNMLFAPPLSRLYFPPHCRNLSVARHVVRDERLQTKEEKLFLLSPHRFIYTHQTNPRPCSRLLSRLDVAPHINPTQKYPFHFTKGKHEKWEPQNIRTPPAVPERWTNGLTTNIL